MIAWAIIGLLAGVAVSGGWYALLTVLADAWERRQDRRRFARMFPDGLPPVGPVRHYHGKG